MFVANFVALCLVYGLSAMTDSSMVPREGIPDTPSQLPVTHSSTQLAITRPVPGSGPDVGQSGAVISFTGYQPAQVGESSLGRDPQGHVQASSLGRDSQGHSQAIVSGEKSPGARSRSDYRGSPQRLEDGMNLDVQALGTVPALPPMQPTDHSTVAVDISPPISYNPDDVASIETLRRHGKDMVGTRVTLRPTSTSSHDPWRRDPHYARLAEHVQLELHAYQMLANAENAAQHQHAEQRIAVIKSEAAVILRSQQSEHAAQVRQHHQDSDQFLLQLRHEQNVANQRYLEQQQANTRLTEELQYQRAEHHQAQQRLQFAEQQAVHNLAASPEPTRHYATPSVAPVLRSTAEDASAQPTPTYHSMDDDDAHPAPPLVEENARLRARITEMENEIINIQNWTFEQINGNQTSTDPVDNTPFLPASSTPSKPPADATTSGGALGRNSQDELASGGTSSWMGTTRTDPPSGNIRGNAKSGGSFTS